MGMKAFVVKPEGRRPPLPVLGTQVTVLASREECSDQRITLQSGSEGTGPPPHSHDWDESFFVSAGQIEFTCDGETTMCEAGTFVHVPAGTTHSFHYGPDGGEMLEITAARSNAIEMFTALGQVHAGPQAIAESIALLEDHGVTLHL